MKFRFATAVVALMVVFATALPSAAALSPFLSVRAAKHALRVNLARGFGIHRVSATCKRRSRTRVTCGWHGRRGTTSYRGRAAVRRAGGGTVVQLTHVHRV